MISENVGGLINFLYLRLQSGWAVEVMQYTGTFTGHVQIYVNKEDVHA